MRQAAEDDREQRLLAELDLVLAGEARLFAQRVDLLVDAAVLSRRLHGTDGIERYLAGDLAGTLRVGAHAAALRLADAERLHHTLTRTLTGLRTGRLV